MKFEEIEPILKKARLPVVYRFWPENHAPRLPYLIWYLPDDSNFEADNTVFVRKSALNVELYTKNKDVAMERTVEAIFNEAGLPWEKAESYLDSEHMYEVLYEMEDVINV